MGKARKFKRDVAIWKSYEGTIIDKDANEEIKRLERRYNKHRSRSQAAT